MSTPALEHPLPWSWPLSVADLSVIEGLSEATRAIVERYLRAGGGVISANEDRYEAGFEDGAEAMRDEIEMEVRHASPRPSRHKVRG